MHGLKTFQKISILYLVLSDLKTLRKLIIVCSGIFDNLKLIQLFFQVQMIDFQILYVIFLVN